MNAVQFNLFSLHAVCVHCCIIYILLLKCIPTASYSSCITGGVLRGMTYYEIVRASCAKCIEDAEDSVGILRCAPKNVCTYAII